MLWIVLLIVLILALIGYGMWKVTRKRKLPASSTRRYQAAWQSVTQILDPHRRVVEAEKIIDTALTELGYQGTFADKLRKAGPRFSHVQQLWDAHKLRNRIAHEMNLSLSEGEVRSAMSAFERALKQLS